MHEDLKPYSLEEIEPTIFSSGVWRDNLYAYFLQSEAQRYM
jgi:hypothetical protein